MKKFFIFAMATLLAACSDEQTEVDRATDKEEAFPVTEARAFVESLMTQRTRGEAEEESFFIHGDFICDWDAAQFSSGRIYYSQDVPAAEDENYCRYNVDSLGKPLLTPIYHKLVVIEEQETGLHGAFVRYYVPDPAHALSHDAAYYDALLNGNQKTEFTGYSFYTDLDGWLVAAGRYAEGILQASVSLADAQYTREEIEERFTDVLGGLAIAHMQKRSTRGAGTDETTNWDWDLGEIEEVVVLPDPGFKDWEPLVDHSLLWYDYGDDEHSGGGGGGGGGNAGSPGKQPTDDDPDKPGDPNTYDKNPNLRTKEPKLTQAFDDFLKDCMGQLLINSIDEPISFVESNSQCYNWASHTVYYTPDCSDFALMEELIHAKQHLTHGTSFLTSHILNMELEAKVLWALFLNRQDRNDDADHALGGKKARQLFLQMGWELSCGITNIPLYNSLANILKHQPSYAKNSYDPGYYGMETYYQLMKDCIEKYL